MTTPLVPDTTTASIAPRTIRTAPTPAEQNYPKNGAHQWLEFAFLAIEAGGYADLTAVNPYTGERLWVAEAARDDNPYTNLRRLIDAMEAEHFLDGPETDDNG